MKEGRRQMNIEPRPTYSVTVSQVELDVIHAALTVYSERDKTTVAGDIATTLVRVLEDNNNRWMIDPNPDNG